MVCEIHVGYGDDDDEKDEEEDSDEGEGRGMKGYQQISSFLVF